MNKSACLLTLLTSTSACVLADDNAIERIVVTADLQQQSPLNLASSVSVLGAETIEQRQAQHLQEILNIAPNLNFTSGASRGRFVQIRGIGERSQFSEPVNPSVGFVIDDMDFSGTLGIGTLFDVQQVEVLRGPQGTAFGASAMAGLLKIKTNDPTEQAQGHFNLSLAQQDSYNLAAAYGDAISDQWQYRVALQQYKSDGFTNNTFLQRDDVENIDELTSRVKLRYLASDTLTLDFALHYFDVDNGYDAFSLDNDGQTRSDQPGFDRQETVALSVNADWQLSLGTLKILANTSDSDIDYGYDEDWTYVGFHPFGYSSTDYYFRERDTDSLDVRLSNNDSNKWFGGSTDWVVGAFIRSTDESLRREYTFLDQDFLSDYEYQATALYGQLDSALTDNLTLTFGARVEKASIDYQDNTGFVEDEDDTLVGGKLVLGYQQTEDTLLYAGIYRGYKLGGFNPDQRLTDQQRRFGAEFNWNYELGIKRNLFDGDVTVSASIFFMDRKDTQVADFATQTIADTGATSFIDVIGNADVAENKGAEFEFVYRVSEDAQIFANLGLLDAQIAGYTNARGDVIAEQDQAQSPNYTFNIGTIMHFGQRWMLRVDADGKDSFRFSDGHDTMSPSYVLYNARLVYEMDNWQASLWGKNLTDKTYFVRGFGGFSNDPRDEFAFPEPYVQLGDGRQIGVSLDYRF